MQKLKRVPVWQTSDGRTFDIKAAADSHQAELNTAAFFEPVVDHDTAVRLVELIKADIEGFREQVGPMIRRPRAKKGEGTVVASGDDTGDAAPASTSERRVPRTTRAA